MIWPGPSSCSCSARAHRRRRDSWFCDHFRCRVAALSRAGRCARSDDSGGERLVEARTGKSRRHFLVRLLRQSVFGRRAGYENVNDAGRLCRDPAKRWVVGGGAPKRCMVLLVDPGCWARYVIKDTGSSGAERFSWTVTVFGDHQVSAGHVGDRADALFQARRAWRTCASYWHQRHSATDSR